MIYFHIFTFLLANGLPTLISFSYECQWLRDDLLSMNPGKGEGRVIEMHTFVYKERRDFSLMCIPKYIFLITTLKFFMIISLIKQRQKLLINISEACFTFIWRSQTCFFITFFCSICLLCLNYSFFQSYCTKDQ